MVFLLILLLLLPQNEYYNTCSVLQQIYKYEECLLAKIELSSVPKQISTLNNVHQQNYPLREEQVGGERRHMAATSS